MLDLIRLVAVLKTFSTEYVSSSAIFEKETFGLPSDGKLNLAICQALRKAKEKSPVQCKTGYISTIMVKPECQASVATELLQNTVSVTLGSTELDDTKTGYAYTYKVI